MAVKISIINHSHKGYADTIPGVPSLVDLAFADPPYNFGVKYADDPTKDRMTPAAYEDFCSGIIYTMSQNLKPGGTAWWLCPSAHMDFIPALMTKHVGPLIYRIIKTETFAQYQQANLTDDYRMLFVAQKPGGPLTLNPDAIRIPSKRQELYKDKRADPRGRVPGQTWEIRRLQGTSTDHVDWHKAQLPPELLSRIALGWTNPGDTILDMFAGSGNFALVCKALGRNFYGVDQSPTYVGKMKERIA
jgi:site-specific DNA-methyltransferase (adenine-specific)